MYRNIYLAVLLTLALAGTAAAQIPTKGNVFFGYSYLDSDLSGNRASVNGWNGSLEGKVFPFVGIVADLSGYYGSQNFPVSCGSFGTGCAVSAKANMHSVVFGPRVSVPIGKFTPFGEALFGVSHISGSATGFSDSNTSFADAFGGGLDYRIVHGLSFRVEGDLLETRFFSNTQQNFRLSAGLAAFLSGQVFT
jgi:hypothetical protein